VGSCLRDGSVGFSLPSDRNGERQTGPISGLQRPLFVSWGERQTKKTKKSLKISNWQSHQSICLLACCSLTHSLTHSLTLSAQHRKTPTISPHYCTIALLHYCIVAAPLRVQRVHSDCSHAKRAPLVCTPHALTHSLTHSLNPP
jgi:hypothetical protein